ncbi:probable RNA helicase SDE3 [Andrographis paniculata]|uniref:probable RNA helicase SDE3 n=1 Tax=Andrographis paniculata TaxID=175694 RepID=UPI0021E9788A|nr:probable RNA helicase SDE3 [Andrographis paniculata]
MGISGNKSDEEYGYIGDKGDIGFIDIDHCRSVCQYNPETESDIVIISVPFPLVDGKPQSGFVGKTIFNPVTIKNIHTDYVELWSVSIYDSKPENTFTLSILKPPTADSDEDYIQDFMESFTLEDRVLPAEDTLTIWVSCKPKEIGLHSAAVHFSVGNEVIERLVFVLAEDNISRSLASERPFQRIRGKKQDLVNVSNRNAAFVVGRRPASAFLRPFRRRIGDYPIADDIRDVLMSRVIPEAVRDGLCETNYGMFFSTLIAMEEIKLEDDMHAYDMECVALRGRRNQFLSLEVPGLAEKRPSLVSGDFIFVKLATEIDTTKPPYQGYIHRVEAEEIFLKFNQDLHVKHREGNLYNVQFSYNRTGMRRLYQAIEAAEQLNRSFLFPSSSSTMRIQRSGELVPKSKVLNEDQKACVETILSCRGGYPYLIHGPPGTGKTMTLIEAILQIYTTRSDARILVCAPSNSAADHILERLIYRSSVEIQPNDIFRLNAFTRAVEDVDPNVLEFCSLEDGLFKCPPNWDLIQFRIIVSTYTSASLLYAEGVKRGHFSYFFLDEAGQASEPETMVPIAQFYSRESVIVLAGDPMQLGPVVFSRDAETHGLGTSYMERLFDCAPYGNGDKTFITKLVRNYRTHEAILRLPSELFYEGELIPCKEENAADYAQPWEELVTNKNFPLLFIGIQGCDEREGSNPSWFNRIEVSKVIDVIASLTEKGVREEDIGVITPYRQQVSKIRGALDNLDIADIKVGSVEQFQGQEREVIIISTVRSTVRHNEFDKLHYLGFLNNPRRFNVSVTRAKSMLIVIGNPHILCKDPNWNELLWYCVDNNSYKGCFLPEREVVPRIPIVSGRERRDAARNESQQPTDTALDQGGQWEPYEYKPDEGNWVGDQEYQCTHPADNWGGNQKDQWEIPADNWGGNQEGDQWEIPADNWGGDQKEDQWQPPADNWGGNQEGDQWAPPDNWGGEGSKYDSKSYADNWGGNQEGDQSVAPDNWGGEGSKYDSKSHADNWGEHWTDSKDDGKSYAGGGNWDDNWSHDNQKPYAADNWGGNQEGDQWAPPDNWGGKGSKYDSKSYADNWGGNQEGDQWAPPDNWGGKGSKYDSKSYAANWGEHWKDSQDDGKSYAGGGNWDDNWSHDNQKPYAADNWSSREWSGSQYDQKPYVNNWGSEYSYQDSWNPPPNNWGGRDGNRGRRGRSSYGDNWGRRGRRNYGENRGRRGRNGYGDTRSRRGRSGWKDSGKSYEDNWGGGWNGSKDTGKKYTDKRVEEGHRSKANVRPDEDNWGGG